MRTRLFGWAAEQKLDIGALAEMTGYTPRHLYRIQRMEKRGQDVPDAFKAALVDRMGDWARSLFLPSVSPASHTPTRKGATDAAEPASRAPAGRDEACVGEGTGAAAGEALVASGSEAA